MKGKLFTQLQFELVISRKKTSFWEVIKEGNKSVLPAYKVNEVLYLKEPYKRRVNKYGAEDNYSFLYKYGSNHSEGKLEKYGNNEDVKWENKLFMSAAAARYFIQIINVKKEALRDIDCCDCIENGLAPEKCHKHLVGNKKKDRLGWVYEFRLTKGNVWKKIKSTS